MATSAKTAPPKPATSTSTATAVSKTAVKARGAFTRGQTIVGLQVQTAESKRLAQDKTREANWKRWGPYLSERQWATVREDYSPTGSCWDYFPHDHARSRAYRWGEDGLLGFCDRQCHLCFSVALWNEKDPILKERLFGLTGPEGNHGEDCKECYYYLDSTPTHSYMKALYKYPQAEYPYGDLVEENRRRGVGQPEYELEHTGIFDNSAYWDVFAEYAKASPDDMLIRLTVANRGKEKAKLHLLPTLWYRNTWAWEDTPAAQKPILQQVSESHVVGTNHETLHNMYLYIDSNPIQGKLPEMLWTENETRDEDHTHPYSKDAFHRYLIRGEGDAVNPEKKGTKMAAHYELEVEGGQEAIVKLRLTNSAIFSEKLPPFGEYFDIVFKDRIREADEFYSGLLHKNLGLQEVAISRQAYAGLLWSKQFYHYDVKKWLGEGEATVAGESPRLAGCNSSTDWAHLINKDVISMPDKWEYPWYASWDLAFHMIPFAKVDPDFAKKQLSLLLGDKYFSPSGEMPASEMDLGAVHPPVHAWAVLQIYKMTAIKGKGDQRFLLQCFDRLRLNFDWWANREDSQGRTVFSGGCLGLNDIGLIDQSKPLPSGGQIELAEGVVWMAFFCSMMLDISLELASTNPQTYEALASQFLDHFISLCDTINSTGGNNNGLWNEEQGFYYDRISYSGEDHTLHVRSMLGLLPLLASTVLEDTLVQKLPGFKKRLTQLLQDRPDIANQISLPDGAKRYHLCAVSSGGNRLASVLKYLLDEEEFLSPYGIRSLSKIHESQPVQLNAEGQVIDISYVAGESRDKRFGGNVNWRGPVWLCVNFLLTEALERYFFYYGEDLKVECPTGSGNKMNLLQVSQELCHRIVNLFVPDKDGRRPCHGDDPRYTSDPHWKELVLFYEYFNGDSGKGCGASHKTGWTALISRYIDKVSKNRS